jgi:hypothetical protein
MAYAISNRAKELLNQPNIEPNVVMCIEGYEFCFGAQITKVYARIGQDGLLIGGFILGGVTKDETILDYISLDGTSTSISQQLDTDKGGSSSTQTMKIRVIDFDQKVSRLISSGFDVDDCLYRNVKISLGFKQGAFPDDYIDLFNGKIQTIESGSGFVEFTIAHPEDLKRSEIFQKVETKLVADADYNTVTIQDLFYSQRGDVTGTVQIRYLHVFALGDVANVSVSGNLITVSMEDGVTKAKTIKKSIEENIDSVQLVTVKITGNGSNTQVQQAVTDMEQDTELELESVLGLIAPSAPLLRSYVRINDELIEYTTIDEVNNKLLGCTRQQLNSFAQSHKIDDQVTSFYKLGDGTETSNALDLALNIMLSGGDDYIKELGNIEFYNFGGVTNYTNGILFKKRDLVRDYNIQRGDAIVVAGAVNGSNNFTSTIENFEVIDLGTIVYVDGQSFVAESGTPAVANFHSKFDVLPDGIAMSPNQIDIDRFEELKVKFPATIINYELYLKDTVNVKDFIQKDLFLPSALYALPRKGRSSVGATAPPLYDGDSKFLTLENVKSPKELKISRSINKNFYNAIVYEYNEDSISDKRLTKDIVYSATSADRIKSPVKPYKIDARGVRVTNLNKQIIKRNSDRYIQRYQFAAESIPVSPTYSVSYSIEIGDSIVFGDEEMHLTDTTSGTREFKPRVFEVTNKQFDWKNGSIKLQLTDTNYSTGIRYGTWSPSSNVSTGSTTTRIHIEESFASESEKLKWLNYVNRTIRVRSKDYSVSYLVKFQGFDSADPHMMMVTPALPSVPVAGMLVDVPKYDELNLGNDALYKAVHPFWSPSLKIVSGTSQTEFEVSVSDAAKLYVNSLLRISSDDYSVDSGTKTIKVQSIIGTTITCSSIGFIPSVGQNINLVGFVSDKGSPYVWV